MIELDHPVEPARKEHDLVVLRPSKFRQDSRPLASVPSIELFDVDAAMQDLDDRTALASRGKPVLFEDETRCTANMRRKPLDEVSTQIGRQTTQRCYGIVGVDVQYGIVNMADPDSWKCSGCHQEAPTGAVVAMVVDRVISLVGEKRAKLAHERGQAVNVAYRT